MSRQRVTRKYVGDFETTVYTGQTSTEVWASALVEIGTEDVKIFHSIDDTFKHLTSLGNVIIYYHNLKFDGAFWVDYLIRVLNFKQAYNNLEEFIKSVEEGKPMQAPESIRNNQMPNKSFNYLISSTGQWYGIKIKYNHKIIELRDSMKLLPFSVREIGRSFGTKHKKLDMEYEGVRWAGCEITEDEKKYIANDVLVVAEALQFMFNEGHDKLTIGACCLQEFKNIISDVLYDELFPNLYEKKIDENLYGSPTIGDYIHKSYRGGWCYVVPQKQNKLFKKGLTADVNSLYPSMMSSESGNKYPVRYPVFWTGNYIPDICTEDNVFYFIRIKTRFYIKENMLPFVQIKNSRMYLGNESLTSSDIKNARDGKYYTHFYDSDGVLHDTRRTLTMTMTDFKLFLEHYNVVDFEILDGCYFQTQIGIFDEYINKYKKIKMVSKGAMRTLAKLFLNNLYGKMAASMDSSFKIAFKKEDGSIGYINCTASDKTPGYIPIGSAITSYARNFTIRAAQANYYGPNNRGFIYADTDSIHCDLKPSELVGVPVHETEFCHWKLESYWSKAIFARQKTYIEYVTHEDGEKVTPYYNIKCAGMPEKCKELLNISMTTREPLKDKKYSIDELRFLQEPRTMLDFKIGLKVPGKLLPKRMIGGIVLQSTTYEMR